MWFAVVLGGLRWFAVVFGGLRWFAVIRRTRFGATSPVTDFVFIGRYVQLTMNTIVEKIVKTGCRKQVAKNHLRKKKLRKRF